jgi:hypothetical protein
LNRFWVWVFLPFKNVFFGKVHAAAEGLRETRVCVMVDSPLVGAEMYDRWKAAAGAALRAEILAVADEIVIAERRILDDNAETIISAGILRFWGVTWNREFRGCGLGVSWVMSVFAGFYRLLLLSISRFVMVGLGYTEDYCLDCFGIIVSWYIGIGRSM